jgi:DNA-binding protein Fis
VLASVNNNKTRAAEILAISRKALREKLKRYGLEPPT